MGLAARLSDGGAELRAHSLRARQEDWARTEGRQSAGEARGSPQARLTPTLPRPRWYDSDHAIHRDRRESNRREFRTRVGTWWAERQQGCDGSAAAIRSGSI